MKPVPLPISTPTFTIRSSHNSFNSGLVLQTQSNLYAGGSSAAFMSIRTGELENTKTCQINQPLLNLKGYVAGTV